VGSDFEVVERSRFALQRLKVEAAALASLARGHLNTD